MLPLFDPLRNVNFISVLFRMVFALVCGAAIGLERSYKNRPAGFRTHILICLGGSIASMTGLYLYLNAHVPTDMARLGAQVVSGLGFIGAGTIIVTKKQTIKGLTTAAGLWASGIIGLAAGAGFYEGALVATVLILVTELCFPHVGKHARYAPEFRLILRYRNKLALDRILRYCKDRKLAITDMHITGSGEQSQAEYTAVLSMRQQGDINQYDVLSNIRANEEILEAEIMEESETGV